MKKGHIWPGQSVLEWLWSPECEIFSDSKEEIVASRAEVARLLQIATSPQQLIEALQHISHDHRKLSVFSELAAVVEKYIEELRLEEEFSQSIAPTGVQQETLEAKVLEYITNPNCALLPVNTRVSRPMLRELASYESSVFTHLHRLVKQGRFFPDMQGLAVTIRAEVRTSGYHVERLLIFLSSTTKLWKTPGLSRILRSLIKYIYLYILFPM